MLRLVRTAAFAAIAVLVIAVGVNRLWPEFLRGVIGASTPGVVSVGGPFALTDHTGARVSDASYRGRFMLIYFGYTFCPDVCPTELQTVAGALERLGPAAARVVPLFITIDPERDTVTALRDYVTLFDDRLVGLTGSVEEIAAVARAYRVFYAKATPRDSSTYLMDHSSFLYLMAPDGSFRALFRQGMGADELAQALRTRLAG